MATKPLISEAEYLAMHFDGPEPDFVDGGLVERAMPNMNHGRTQSILAGLFFPFRKTGRLFAITELRIPAVGGRYRVVDLVVFRGSEPAVPVPSETPFAVVEIISPDDSYAELMAKLADYEARGIPHIWTADPNRKRLSRYHRGDLLRIDAFDLPEFDLRITPEQLFD